MIFNLDKIIQYTLDKLNNQTYVDPDLKQLLLMRLVLIIEERKELKP